MHLCMIVSISGSGLLSSTDMESVLEVGRDNQLLSEKDFVAKILAANEAKQNKSFTITQIVSTSLIDEGKGFLESPIISEKTPSFTFKWKLPCHNGVNFLERSCSSEGLISSTDIWASYTPDCLKGACPWISIRGWDDTDVC